MLKLDKKEMEETLKKVEEIVIPAAEKRGLDIVDVEYVQEGGYLYLRVFIEKQDADITLEDCGNLSGDIDEAVDRLIPHKFFLEVSSPGVERPLKKEADYIRFNGEKIRVMLKHKINDKRTYEGVLQRFEDNKIYLRVDADEIEIPFNEIKKANIVFDFTDF